MARAKVRGLYGELASTWVIADLGELYLAAGQHDKAIALHKEYADWCPRQYGPKNTETRMVLGKVIQAYLAGKQEEKALAVLNDTFAGDKQQKSPQDWTINNTESLIGAALLGQKKYEEAEPLLLAGYKGLNDKRFFIPPVAQVQRVNEAVERLVRFYEATNKPAKVEEYRKLLRK